MTTSSGDIDIASDEQEELDLHEASVRECRCGTRVAVVEGIATACTKCGFVFNADARIADALTIDVADPLDQFGDHHNFSTGPAPQFRTGQLTGVMMGHFLLEDMIGSGGMGSVYRALDTSLQRYVAVKVINEVKYGSDQQPLTSAIVREAVAQARLNHPNIVTIYYVGRTSAEPFLAMELVQGSTLREKLTAGPLAYPEAIRIAIQLVRALEHASRINIVHGDIKPNNLLLDGFSNVKLSDFGLARSTLDTGSERPLSGTPAYMAPELVTSHEVTIQSDMYAVGITMFEMVFGRLPFTVHGGTVRDHLDAHAKQKIEFPDPWPREIPLEFKGVIERLLSKDPGKRYSNYIDLLSDLQTIRPVTTTVAGIPLRAAAFAIDQIVLLACFLPFAIPIYFTTLQSTSYVTYASYVGPWVPLIALAALSVPIGHFTLIRRGHRTLGRYLFQLRVTEQHGLVLPRESSIARGLLRNATAWLIPLGLFLGLYLDIADEAMYVIVLLILLVEVLFTVSSTDRRALHDILCHSRVVLDNKPPQIQKVDSNISPISEANRINLSAQETMIQM